MHAMQKQLPGNRLRELRIARGWKPYDVAHFIGADPATVSRWERATVSIRDDTKFRLAELYDVSVPYLMGWDDEIAAA